MIRRKVKPQKLKFKVCMVRYDIQCENGTVYKEAKVSFVTDDGYFAAVYPNGSTCESSEALVGAMLIEAVGDASQEIAGTVLKCTENAIYGMIKKTFINRTRSNCAWDISVFPMKKAVNNSATLWWYPWGTSNTTMLIDHGEFNKDESGECFYITDNRNWKEFLGSIVVYQGLKAVGITTSIEKEHPHILRCLPLDVIAKELCELINERNQAIAKGLIEEEKDSEFIIHNNILEQYEGLDKTVIIPDGVKVIGSRAFEFNNFTTEIILPSSVKIIDDLAFRHCFALEKINLPQSIKKIGRSAFYGCENLKEIIIPENIDVLEESVFANCENLEKVILPKYLVEIEEDAFRNCSNLTQIDIPKTVNVIGNCAFASCEKIENINIPVEATVGTLAFSETKWLDEYFEHNDALIINKKLICAKKQLKEYSIPDGVVEIGGFAFCCNEATHINIPSSVSIIGEYAFADSKVEKLIIPEGIKEIEEYTFYDCSKLMEIIIPKTVTHISNQALAKIPQAVVTILNPDEDAKIYECSFVNQDGKTFEVKEIRAPYGSETMRCAIRANIPFVALEGAPSKYVYIDEVFYCEGNVLKKYLGHESIVNIPKGIEKIGENAFFGEVCKSVKIVNLPDSVIKINHAAFMMCDELEEIYGNNVEAIEGHAFASCRKLRIAEFPKIKSVGYNAFNQCEKLEQKHLIKMQCATFSILKK